MSARNEGAVEHPAALAARAVVSQLVRAGITTFVLCPGSRSAPLAYALYDARAAGLIELRVEIDERVAGFIALGSGIAGKPAAVVTTSGSAVANLHPAVEEAAAAGVPLVALASDRPHEKRHVRATQTTDQVAVLGGSVRMSVEVPAAELDANGRIVSMRGPIGRAIRAALGPAPGPVLINMAFREPLVPVGPWANPAADVGLGTAAPGLGEAPRCVVVAGPSTLPALRGTASAYPKLAAALANVPILAEPSSPLRSHPNAIACHPILLRTELGEQIERAVVIGHPTLTREVSHLLASVEVFAVDEPAGYTDAAGTAQVVSLGEVPQLLEGNSQWLDSWRGAAARAQEAVAEMLGEGGPDRPLTFESVARAISAADAVPTQVAASSIIRMMNLYAQTPASPVYSNRGLAGIDGTMSTAIGIGIARGEPVRVVTGDLAFLHDSGALYATGGQAGPNLDVVVVNDHGGSLFSSLEYGTAQPQLYDALFRTEKHVDVRALAQAAGFEYVEPATVGELEQLLAQSFKRRIIHVHLGRNAASEERARRADFASRVQAAVSVQKKPRISTTFE